MPHAPTDTLPRPTTTDDSPSVRDGDAQPSGEEVVVVDLAPGELFDALFGTGATRDADGPPV